MLSIQNPFRKQAKPEVQGLSRNSKDEEEEDEDEEEDEEDDDDDEQAANVDGAYDPAEYESLNVSAEVKELFGFIMRYTPQSVELDQELRPFVPDLIPAVGDIDAFLKVSRPDDQPDTLGLTVLDEPSASQTDPSVLDLQLRALSKDTHTSKSAVVKRLSDPDKNPKEIDSWIASVRELHLASPPPTVHYSRNMPDIESLMQEWPPEYEELLKEVRLPSADLDCSLEEYATLVC
ncbi:unnamed protein product, partial [Ixodes hexagonus]